MTTITLTQDHWIKADQRVFSRKKNDIDGALNGDTGIIDGVTEKNKEDIFYMLMFCLCVPQSKAIKAEEAIENLRSNQFYFQDIPLTQVTKILMGKVRFQSTKAKRLIEAKKIFQINFWGKLKEHYQTYVQGHSQKYYLEIVREFLIHSVNGIGMKLAGHFMRNIGMGGLAILDVHIISGLKKRGVIDIDKLGPSKMEYLKIEQKMKDYSNQVGITLDELDLLLWSQKTGYVFK